MDDEQVMRDEGHPVFAACYDLITGWGDRRIIGPERRRLIDCCKGRVLEVGVGTGASFPDWQAAEDAGKVVSVAAVEPDPHMRRRAAARADRLGLEVDLRAAVAERLPFGDATFDAVATFLVLCTVADPVRALAEIYRVLRPGGTFVFIEHVRGDEAAARWQHRVRPVWATLGAGCQLDRDTVSAIVGSGFRDLSHRSIPLPFPLYRLVAGTAVRPSPDSSGARVAHRHGPTR